MFKRNVSFHQFTELVDGELSGFLKPFGFSPTFKDLGRGYGAYFLRDDMALVLTWEFQSPRLECDLARLPAGDDPPLVRLAQASGPGSQNWSGLENLLNHPLNQGLPPDIGNFPTADDYRRGLKMWREALEVLAPRYMARTRNE